MRPSYVRWGIVFLLLATSLVAMIERGSSSLLLFLMQRDLNFTPLQYGQIIGLTAFISLLAAVVGGWLIDRVGARWGMALSLLVCSLAHLATAAVSSALGLGVARSIFAAGAPANYVAATKAMSEHIAPQGRGTALAVYSLGAKIAPMLAPPIILMTADRFGWRFALMAMGVIGLLLLLLWLWRYRPPRENVAEPTPVENESAPTVLSLFATPETTKEKSFWRSPIIWLLFVSNVLTGQVGSVLTGWLGEQFAPQERAGQFLPMFLFTLIGTLGSGIISDYRIRAGQEPAASRTQLMLGATFLMLFCWLIPFASSLWAIIALTALVSLGNASWAVMMTALLLDVTPTRSVGLVMGIVVASSGWLSGLVMSVTKLFPSDGASVVALIAVGGLQLLALWFVRLATRPQSRESLV